MGSVRLVSEARFCSNVPPEHVLLQNLIKTLQVAVPGTPWCIVWTGDGKHFFFNPSARLSLWELPEELRHRTDIDKLVEAGPEKKEDKPAAPPIIPESVQPLLLAPTSAPMVNPSVLAAAKEDPTPPPVKKTKVMELDSVETMRKKREEKAEQLRDELPQELRLTKFNELLAEHNISAFSTFEREIGKLEKDERFLLVHRDTRRQAFDDFLAEKAQVH